MQKKLRFVTTHLCITAMMGAPKSQHTLLSVLLLESNLSCYLLMECILTQAELAKRCGIKSQPQVSTALSKLKERGIVTANGHKSIAFNPRYVHSEELVSEHHFQRARNNYADMYARSKLAKRRAAERYTKTEKKQLVDIAKRSSGLVRDFNPFEQQENPDVAVQQEEDRLAKFCVSHRQDGARDCGAEDACGRAAGSGLSLAGEGPQGGG